MGLAGIVLATIFIEDVRARNPIRSIRSASLLAGSGSVGLAFRGSVLGLNFLPTGVGVGLIVISARSRLRYVLPRAVHARARAGSVAFCRSRACAPRCSAASSIAPASARCVPVRRCCPARLPYDGVSIRPHHPLQRHRRHGHEDHHSIILRHIGFRRALTVNALISTTLAPACATFMPGVSFVWIVAVLNLGGFFRSLEFTSSTQSPMRTSITAI